MKKSILLLLFALPFLWSCNDDPVIYGRWVVDTPSIDFGYTFYENHECEIMLDKGGNVTVDRGTFDVEYYDSNGHTVHGCVYIYLDDENIYKEFELKEDVLIMEEIGMDFHFMRQ